MRHGAGMQPEVEITPLAVTDRPGVRPALRAIQVDWALECRSVRVGLERVEVASEETHIYFTVENRCDETLLAFATGLEIEIEGTEIPALIPIGEAFQRRAGESPGAPLNKAASSSRPWNRRPADHGALAGRAHGPVRRPDR